MSTSVCVLARWEAEEFVATGALPHCKKHAHVRLQEALEATGDAESVYRRPIAEWVGDSRRRITMLTGFNFLAKKTASGHVAMNRVEQ
jgi:hypothetical protein